MITSSGSSNSSSTALTVRKSEAEEEKERLLTFKTFLQSEKKKVDSWKVHKNVDDLIKQRIQVVEKMNKDFSVEPSSPPSPEPPKIQQIVKPPKETEEKEESFYGLGHVVKAPHSAKTKKHESDSVSDKKIIDQIMENASKDIEVLTDMLADRMSNATAVVSKAREASKNSDLRETIKQSKVPLGFENIREDEKGPFYDEIIDFLNPFLMNLMGQNEGGLDEAIQLMKDHIAKYEEKKQNLMKIMNINRLIVPYISLDLPGEIILTYNKLEETDPLVAVFRLHPIIGEEIERFGIFLDRNDTNKEVVCAMIWSTIDNMLICLPVVGLNPYPICWNCEKSFGTLACGKCGVAKYCSKECQVTSWKKSHRLWCGQMEQHAKSHKYLVFT